MMNDRLPRLKKSQFINIFAKSIEEENIDRILICTQISLMSEMKDYIEIIFRNTLNVPELNKDISGLKEDVVGLKEDMVVMKEDISGMKGDISVLKEDVIGIKGDISGMKEDINDIAINTAQNLRDITIIKETMATKEDIKDMVVKSDIEDMVRKSDIEYMVTKEDIKDMATKQDIKPILTLIGSYEVRAKNVEDILLQDHKPKISELQKAVFAI